MIYLLLALDKNKSIGIELHNSKIFNFDSDLLISLVQTILIMSDEIDPHPPKGDIRELEIGMYQIGVIEKDHIAYIFIQDTYDNEQFTSMVVKSVVKEFHDLISKSNLNKGIKDHETIKKRVADLLQTMVFPKDLMGEVDEVIGDVLDKIPTIDTIFMCDLDDGVVKKWAVGSGNVVQLLKSILSEIPFERSWIGETKLFYPKKIKEYEKSYEAWIIQRIGMTDFCILARCVYSPEERDFIIETIESAAETIQEKVFSKLENYNVT
jgi:hypothetical protein